MLELGFPLVQYVLTERENLGTDRHTGRNPCELEGREEIGVMQQKSRNTKDCQPTRRS